MERNPVQENIVTVRPVQRCVLVALLLALGPIWLTGCLSETSPAAPSSPTAARLAPSAAPTTSASAAPGPTVGEESGPAEVVTATVELAELRPLRDPAIIDRVQRGVKPLTDGQTKYKRAVWSPSAEWIAAVPQDGPGLDVVSVQTGEARPVVTDTYVLEPFWLEPDKLVVQHVAGNHDLLVQYTLDETSITPRVVAESDKPLIAIGAAGGALTYGNGAELMFDNPAHADRRRVALNPLVTAPAPAAGKVPLVAVVPWVSDLQQVRTVLVEVQADQITSTFLSNPGEGLWLPQWAPDGAKLALTGIGGRVVTASVDGRARYDLGPGDLPAWSPDSSRLAFAGASAGKEYLSRDIYLVDWQGAGPRIKLTAAGPEQLYTSPSWSPDGTRIAFVEIDSGQILLGTVPPR